jgi:hypothetical protein
MHWPASWVKFSSAACGIHGNQDKSWLVVQVQLLLLLLGGY